MCNFLSFSIAGRDFETPTGLIRKGSLLILKGRERALAVLHEENPDSHAYISKVLLGSSKFEDETWKYEMTTSVDQLEQIIAGGGNPLQILSIKYDGGLPETELSSSDYRSALNQLSKIDWQREIIEPMKNPEKFIGNLRAPEDVVKLLETRQRVVWLTFSSEQEVVNFLQGIETGLFGDCDIYQIPDNRYIKVDQDQRKRILVENMRPKFRMVMTPEDKILILLKSGGYYDPKDDQLYHYISIQIF